MHLSVFYTVEILRNVTPTLNEDLLLREHDTFVMLDITLVFLFLCINVALDTHTCSCKNVYIN